MAALAPPVRVVTSGAPPFVHVPSGAPPFVAVSGNAPPITIVASGAPPITLLNQDGSIWTGGGGAAPVNSVAPVVSGTPTVGQTISCTTGTWNPAATSYVYSFHDGTVYLQSSASNQYVLAPGDYNKATIGCTVIAHNAAGDSLEISSSNTLGPVAGLAPVNTVAPTITGTPTVGQTLGVTSTWTGVPTPTKSEVWKRGGSPIGGATASTYLLQAADETTLITVTETATNTAGSASATSASVGPIAPASTPAVLSAATASDFSDIFVWGRATTDTSGGTLYAVVVAAAASTPSAAQIVAGTDAAGAAAPSGNIAVSSTGVKDVLVRGLTAVTAYKVCMAQQTAGGNSNVVTASFTTDTLVVAFAAAGLSTGMSPSTGSAALIQNQTDPFGGTNAVRWADDGLGGTGNVILACVVPAYFNGVNKVHLTVKNQGGVAWLRMNPANITTIPSPTHWNPVTGALGTLGTWTSPTIFNVGSGWYMWAGSANLAGADVAGNFSLWKGATDNSISVPSKDGTNIADIHNIRITRV